MTDLYYADDAVTLYAGDCLAVLPTLPDNSVDAVVTDPPAGISFMGRDWDHHRGGRVQWAAWLTEVMREACRVAKPGAHALVWALPRTSHWTAIGIEDAGWEIRDRITHLFGTGFPKSLDVSKAIDRAAGAERTEIVGTKLGRPGMARDGSNQSFDSSGLYGAGGVLPSDITAPATAAAQRWSGWGTALKPAAEDWWLARKPLTGTVAANVLAHGTGALNIDATRIGGAGNSQRDSTACTCPEPEGDRTSRTESTQLPASFEPRRAERSGLPASALQGADQLAPLQDSPDGYPSSPCSDGAPVQSGVADDPTPFLPRPGVRNAPDRCASCGRSRSIRSKSQTNPTPNVESGRWPANVALDEAAAAALDHMSGETVSSLKDGDLPDHRGGQYGSTPASLEGSGYLRGHNDSGGASRFFYTAKAGSDERITYTKPGSGNGRVTGLGGKVRQCNVCETRAIESGAGEPSCGHGDYRWAEPTANKADVVSHPTVKPLSLMRWLVRLVCPPGGLILEPFAGSGTTVEAAILEGFRCIAIEREPDYLPLITQRLNRRRDPVAYLTAAGEDLGLFGDSAGSA